MEWSIHGDRFVPTGRINILYFSTNISSLRDVRSAYTANDAAMARIMFDYANYGIGVAYEMNTSSLKEASKGFGCFEVFLKYSPMTKSFSLY